MTQERDYVVVEDTQDNIIEVIEAPPGPPGADGPSVHWSTEPPTEDDGSVGDFWVVTD